MPPDIRKPQETKKDNVKSINQVRVLGVTVIFKTVTMQYVIVIR